MKDVALVVSSKDPAGINIKECLIASGFGKEEGLFHGETVYGAVLGKLSARVYTVSEESVFCDNIDKEIDADFFCFATKHEGVAKIPSFSVHVPGNWGSAGLGGSERELCAAYAGLMREFFFRLKELSYKSGYDVIQECTHHGPFLEKPVMFIEIGSCAEQWNDKKAGRIIAEAIVSVFSGEIKKHVAGIGIGGPHYCPNFAKVMERSEIAFGHVCPKYMLDSLDEEMLRQAVERNYERPEIIVLDWKGLGQHKERVKEMIEKVGLDYKKTNDF